MSSPGRPAPTDPAVVGRVVRPHGLAGEVVVEPVEPSSNHFAVGTTLWLDGRWRDVVRARPQRERWLLLVDGVTDRDAAEALRGVDLVIEADELPTLDEDSFYVHDLVGCRVESSAGTDLGEIVGVVPGAQDQLEIELGHERMLFPMVRDWLKVVDIEGRRVVMDAPPGLAEATRTS